MLLRVNIIDIMMEEHIQGKIINSDDNVLKYYRHMRSLYTLFITHVHLFVNNNLHVVKMRIICYDFNNKLAHWVYSIMYVLLQLCVHVCVEQLGHILSTYCKANLRTSNSLTN